MYLREFGELRVVNQHYGVRHLYDKCLACELIAVQVMTANLPSQN